MEDAERGSRRITKELQLRPANGRRSGAAAELGRPECRSAVVFAPLLRAVLKDSWTTARLDKRARRGSVRTALRAGAETMRIRGVMLNPRGQIQARVSDAGTATVDRFTNGGVEPK